MILKDVGCVVSMLKFDKNPRFVSKKLLYLWACIYLDFDTVNDLNCHVNGCK